MVVELKENITLTSCNEIEEICRDFFNLTGITYFNFVRAYDDGTRLCLSNNYDWMRFVFSNHKNYDFAFEETTESLSSNCLIWDLIDEIREDKLITTARDEFNIDHGFTLITRYSNYTEFGYFATSPGNQHLNMFYINNTDLLQAFMLYFKDKARRIIEAVEKQRFVLEGHSLFWLEKHADGSTSLKDFFKVCDIKRFFLNGELKGIHLSVREAECLAYLFDGKVPKEIAKILGISYRTVECYIDNAKLKMRCSHRGELLETARQSGFMTIYEVVKAKQHRRGLLTGINNNEGITH